MTDRTPPLPPEDHDRPDDQLETEPAFEEQHEAPKPPAPPTPPPVEPAAAPPPAAAPRLPAPAYDPMAKSPGLALFLSILVPGLGHLYVASYERALMIVSAIAVSAWTIAYSEGRLWPLAFVIAFSYFFSIFDAYREAQIANLDAGQELPKPRRRGEGRLVFGVFLTVLAAVILADNLGLFDIRWFYDWWPVLILLVGVYFIGSWIWERMNAAANRDSNGSE